MDRIDQARQVVHVSGRLALLGVGLLTVDQSVRLHVWQQVRGGWRRSVVRIAAVVGVAGHRVIELTLHLWWSGDRAFDLDDPVDRRRVYEVVLREGTAEDASRYIRSGRTGRRNRSVDSSR